MGFNSATRLNWLPAPSMTYAAGQTTYSQIPKVGLLRRVMLLIAGTMTAVDGDGTHVLGAEAPWSLIQRLKLTANGNTALFDMSGYGAMLASLKSMMGFSGFGSRPVIPDSATVPGVVATNMAAANYAAGVAAGANTWAFALEIPLALSNDWRDPLGLILAAAPDTQLQIELTWCASFSSTAASRAIPMKLTGTTATAAFVGTATPYIEFFTVPASTADYPDLSKIHTWQEIGPAPIAATGDFDVVIPRGNTAMRLLHIVWTNSAADATNVLGRQFRFNQNEVPYQINRQLDAVLARKRNVRDLPDGVYEWDLWNTGTPRDAINTLGLNDLTSRLTIGAAATIAGVSDVRTLVEQIVSLTGAVAGSA